MLWLPISKLLFHKLYHRLAILSSWVLYNSLLLITQSSCNFDISSCAVAYCRMLAPTKASRPFRLDQSTCRCVIHMHGSFLNSEKSQWFTGSECVVRGANDQSHNRGSRQDRDLIDLIDHVQGRLRGRDRSIDRDPRLRAGRVKIRRRTGL